jgi:chromosomal replication initiation ATPase DnaA
MCLEIIRDSRLAFCMPCNHNGIANERSIPEPLFKVNESHVSTIIESVCETLQIPKYCLVGRSSKRELAEARFIACDLIRLRYPKATLTSIASLFDRDHSTIIYALNTCEALLDYNKPFQRKYKSVMDALMIKEASHDI